MTSQQPRPGAPDFLTTPEAIIDFVNTAPDRHRERDNGTCTCDWNPADIPTAFDITHTDHANAILQDELAERLPSGTHTNNGTYNWLDLTDHLYATIDDRDSEQQQQDSGDAQLVEVAVHMEAAARYIRSWYTDHHPGPAHYDLTAHRSGTCWELHIPHIGVTTIPTKSDADTAARDLIARAGGNSHAELHITWHPTVETTIHRPDQPESTT